MLEQNNSASSRCGLLRELHLFRNSITVAVVAASAFALSPALRAQTPQDTVPTYTASTNIDDVRVIPVSGLKIILGEHDGAHAEYGPPDGPPPDGPHREFNHHRRFGPDEGFMPPPPPRVIYEHPYYVRHRRHLKYYRYNGELWVFNFSTGNRSRVSVGYSNPRRHYGTDYWFEGHRYHQDSETGIRIRIN